MESIANRPLADLVQAIASREPAPGAGVAAAAALALGIACARKAAAITLKHDPDRPGLDRHDGRLADLAERALRLGDRDASCFPAMLREDEDAADKLVEGGEKLLDIVEEARDLVARMAAEADPAMRNDILAARALIDAAARIVRASLVENEAQSSGSSRSEASR
jgi:hypothetical protein